MRCVACSCTLLVASWGTAYQYVFADSMSEVYGNVWYRSCAPQVHRKCRLRESIVLGLRQRQCMPFTFSSQAQSEPCARQAAIEHFGSANNGWALHAAGWGVPKGEPDCHRQLPSKCIEDDEQKLQLTSSSSSSSGSSFFSSFFSSAPPAAAPPPPPPPPAAKGHCIRTA